MVIYMAGSVIEDQKNKIIKSFHSPVLGLRFLWSASSRRCYRRVERLFLWRRDEGNNTT